MIIPPVYSEDDEDERSSTVQELRKIRDIFIWGIALILTLGALMIACHGAPKGPYQMNNEDHEHLLRLITQRQLIDSRYQQEIAPVTQELTELVQRNCKRAGLSYGVDCDVRQDGSVVKKVEPKK